MTTLVTGGTGFIGSYVTHELLKRGEDVISYELIPTTELIGDIADQVKIIRGDILDTPSFFRAVKENNVDRIIHLVFLLIDACKANPRKAIEVNCIGTNSVLEAARTFDIKKVVFASSTAVYGSPEDYGGPAVPIKEGDQLKPSTLYGACKILCEFMCEQYLNDYGIDYVALRPSIVYGYGRKRGGFTFANDVIQYPAMGQPVKISYADQELNWIYVTDTAKALAMSNLTQNLKHHIFNLGGDVHTLRGAAEFVKKLIPGAEITLESGTLGWASRYDTTRISEELGFVPEYSLEKAIEDFIKRIRVKTDNSKQK